MSSIRNLLLASVALAAGIPGAARSAPAAATPHSLALPPLLHPIGAPPPNETVEFDVILPLKNAAGLDTLIGQQQDPSSPQFHRWITPSQFAQRFGPDNGTILQAVAALQSAGLTVTVQSRSLHVAGTPDQVARTFNTGLELAAPPKGHARLVATTPLTLPPGLARLQAVVTAFQNSGIGAAPFTRRSTVGYVRRSTVGYQAATQPAPAGGLFYNDIKQAYGFPSYRSTVTVNGKPQPLDGTGTTVAVLMAGDVLDSDVDTLFTRRNFTQASGRARNPALAARRPVNGGIAFSADDPGSQEASLDVQQVLGAAPGARVVLYNTPDLSDQSLVSGYTAILNDNQADVVSMSFGQCEQYYTAAYNNGVDHTAQLSIFSELFKQGNAQGITFIAASGDSGGLGCINPEYFSGQSGHFVSGVSVPAADPNVTAVGGTNLVTSAASGYGRENAWSDPEAPYDPFGNGTNVSGGVWGAGGGYSTLFARPSYQSLVASGSGTARALPDIGLQVGGCPDIASGQCDGTTGGPNGDRSFLNVVFNGVWDTVIGTSAAAPTMAGATALLVETQGRQGNLNPYLYRAAQLQASGQSSQAAYHQNVPGFNGVVTNSGIFNLTTGNGTPNLSALFGWPGTALAGAPGTPTNP
ncbi:S53 family peptidase [Rhizosaccharibacter radicis]|uniref:S53 family peptidase n=1 Tax=Rhizosaccharibacter radicis TaxID=2782605 RepID=A0ABT1W372_9PROT|nr:S53 family peptidase [Acetobacteraceae bacterium KSS12]